MTKSHWHRHAAPTIADLEHLAREAFADLPEKFRILCRDLVIRVENFPSDEVLDALGLESPFDLLGLFQGVGLAQGGNEGLTGQMPNMIFLYRRPILDFWADHEDTLADVVSHVLVHEIGHHFGLSDADMAAIEAEPD